VPEWHVTSNSPEPSLFFGQLVPRLSWDRSHSVWYLSDFYLVVVKAGRSGGPALSAEQLKLPAEQVISVSPDFVINICSRRMEQNAHLVHKGTCPRGWIGDYARDNMGGTSFLFVPTAVVVPGQ
jgi:hypothetical protein